MPLVVRALRGPSWLAWLSLLFAAQLGAADTIAGPDSDDVQDRAAVHAPVRLRPLLSLFAASPDCGIDNHDELAASPAVLGPPAAQPPETRGSSAAEPRPRLPGTTACVRRCLRAPPFSRSL